MIKDQICKEGKIYGIFDTHKNCYVYVGQSTRSNDFKPHGRVIRKLFKTHPERYRYHILEQNINNKFLLNERERSLIKKYNTQKYFNFTEGGTGGDTISKHPKKEEIYKKRSEKYKQPHGALNSNFKKITNEQQKLIINTWLSLEIKYLKAVVQITGITKHLCKRTLIAHGFTIPNKYETQRLLYKAGILQSNRAILYNVREEKQIINLYEEFVSAKKIAQLFGYKNDSSIFRVLKKYNIPKKSRSSITRYHNLRRSKIDEYE